MKLVRHKTAVGLMGAKSAGPRTGADKQEPIHYMLYIIYYVLYIMYYNFAKPQKEAQPKLLAMSSFSSTATLRRRLATSSLEDSLLNGSWYIYIYPAAPAGRLVSKVLGQHRDELPPHCRSCAGPSIH